MSSEKNSKQGAEPLWSQITTLMREAAAVRKCHACGCYHDALAQLSAVLPTSEPFGAEFQAVLDQGLPLVKERECDCLGCDPCWPADALNLASDAIPDLEWTQETCCGGGPGLQRTWPPLPGNYRVLDSGGHVALCVLHSTPLVETFAELRSAGLAIAGSLNTENLGIERLVINTLANPNLTTLIVCGEDSRRSIGHLPGRSLLCLVQNGTKDEGSIVGAPGKRPVLKNVSSAAVEEFRQTIQVRDHIGETDPAVIATVIKSVPVPSEPRRISTPHELSPKSVAAVSASPLTLDPRGYFVIFPDRLRQVIRVEHYTNDSVLAHVFDGDKAADLCSTITGADLVSLLSHAAYLGRELARAELALKSGDPYVQEAAPDQPDERCCE